MCGKLEDRSVINTIIVHAWMWSLVCLPGCKAADGVCNSKPNAYFTGPGSPNDANSCPYSCNAGYYKNFGVCTACPAGTYNPSPGAVSSSSCTACSGGSYSAATGASSSSTCVKCVAGKYSGSGALA
jgi:hypothetical protein